MTDQHPITPPPELVQEWCATEFGRASDIATQAARWGADQELEACCEWLLAHGYDLATQELHYDRRPEPLSLKEQALAVIENSEICDHLSLEHATILRRALEQLDD